jgi:hypothetical protein
MIFITIANEIPWMDQVTKRVPLKSIVGRGFAGSVAISKVCKSVSLPELFVFIFDQ